jgi:sugar diacid utilization regulator
MMAPQTVCWKVLKLVDK